MASARARTCRRGSRLQPAGTGPLTRSFLRVDRRAGEVVLSALKQAEDRPSTIVRLFNPGDEDADVALSTGDPIAGAFA